MQGLRRYRQGSGWQWARISVLLRRDTASSNSKAGRSRPSASPRVSSRKVLPDMNEM